MLSKLFNFHPLLPWADTSAHPSAQSNAIGPPIGPLHCHQPTHQLTHRPALTLSARCITYKPKTSAQPSAHPKRKAQTFFFTLHNPPTHQPRLSFHWPFFTFCTIRPPIRPPISPGTHLIGPFSPFAQSAHQSAHPISPGPHSLAH